MNAQDLLAAMQDIVERNKRDTLHGSSYKRGMADLLRLAQTMFGESMLTDAERRERDRMENWLDYRAEAQHEARMDAER